jgi:DNA-binding NtrC family response regulator
LGDTDVLDPSLAVKPPTAALSTSPGCGILVFTNDASVLEVVQKAARARLPVHHAGNTVKVIEILTAHRPGVLVTDISEDRATLQKLTARLKEHLPELVTIAVSAHRDVLDMVWLINHGQIFRFLRKPLSPGRCSIALQAALNHHRTLLQHPELVKRHAVTQDRNEPGGILDTMIERLKSVRKFWASV